MSTWPLQPLDSVLSTLSGETWERLRDALQLSVSFGEETVTDLLALDINRHGLATSTFDQTTKPEEAVIGADYEWWVGDDSIGWIRMAVQAKKLILSRKQYNFSSPRKRTRSQIDLLESYANKVGAFPLYCLYNYSDKTRSFSHWQCAFKKFKENDLGCTVVPSKTIRALRRGEKNFDYLHGMGGAVPWRCIASCTWLRKVLRNQPTTDRCSVSNDFFSQARDFPCFHPQLPDFLQTTQAPVLGRKIQFDEAIVNEYYAFGTANRILPKWIMVFGLTDGDLG